MRNGRRCKVTGASFGYLTIGPDGFVDRGIAARNIRTAIRGNERPQVS
jgi:hypothetical protein